MSAFTFYATFDYSYDRLLLITPSLGTTIAQIFDPVLTYQSFGFMTQQDSMKHDSELVEASVFPWRVSSVLDDYTSDEKFILRSALYQRTPLYSGISGWTTQVANSKQWVQY